MLQQMDDDLDFQSDFSVKMSISKRERDWFLSSLEPVVAVETFLICLTFFILPAIPDLHSKRRMENVIRNNPPY